MNRQKNKLIAAGSALAAAGTLTCAAAFLDGLPPQGSLAAVVASKVLLALAVMGVMAAFTWGCDKCESRAGGPIERLPDTAGPSGAAAWGLETAAAGPCFKLNLSLEKEKTLWI